MADAVERIITHDPDPNFYYGWYRPTNEYLRNGG